MSHQNSFQRYIFKTNVHGPPNLFSKIYSHKPSNWVHENSATAGGYDEFYSLLQSKVVTDDCSRGMGT